MSWLKPYIFMIVLGSATWSLGQTVEIRNPFTSPSDVAAGSKIFRSHCAVCHGLEGTGGRGPNLARGEFRHGSGDEALRRTISEGIPGTQMEGIYFSDDQIWQIVAYVRSLKSNSDSLEVSGDVSRGEDLFRNKGGCLNCHIVNGKGGGLGPDLSDVGALRSPEFLKTAIVNPDEFIHSDYRLFRILDREGQRYPAIRLNEDTYSIQLMNMRGDLLSLSKNVLQQIERVDTSLMQSYESVFNSEELEDLTAYLHSLQRKED